MVAVVCIAPSPLPDLAGVKTMFHRADSSLLAAMGCMLFPAWNIFCHPFRVQDRKSVV